MERATLPLADLQRIATEQEAIAREATSALTAMRLCGVGSYQLQQMIEKIAGRANECRSRLNSARHVSG